MENSLAIFKMLNVNLTTILLQGINGKEIKICLHKTCTQTFNSTVHDSQQMEIQMIVNWSQYQQNQYTSTRKK